MQHYGSHPDFDDPKYWSFARTYPAGLTDRSAASWLRRHQDAIAGVAVILCGIVALLLTA